MNATTAAIDLAKNVFQVAQADASARVLEQQPPSWRQLRAAWPISRALVTSPPGSASRPRRVPQGAHGARSVMRAATVAKLNGQGLLGVRHWALTLQARSNHNKAACALANKLARICYAVLRDQTPFGQPATRLGKKIQRQSFELAH